MSHWDRFREFCYYEKLTGGPDPHMRAIEEMCKNQPWSEEVWRSSLYVGLYNVPSAEAVWRVFPAHRLWQWTGKEYHLTTTGKDDLYQWLEQHWRPGGIDTRRERRSCNTPTKFMDFVGGVTQVMNSRSWLMDQKDFENVWHFALDLPRVGRYAATKFTELWHRMHITPVGHNDIRAKGGWSPRTALQYLFPDLMDPYDGSREAVFQAEEAAARLKEWTDAAGLGLSFFEMEVMLCEYKASFSTRRQYPGRSLDSELKYELKLRDYWKVEDTEHMRVRRQLHPEWALGELQGWNGPREACANVLADYGYTWSDYLFHYNGTNDFSDPVRRQ